MEDAFEDFSISYDGKPTSSIFMLLVPQSGADSRGR